MKLIKIFSIFGLAFAIALACSERNKTTGQAKPPEKQPITQAAEPTYLEPTEIIGIVKGSEKGISIVTDTQTYIAFGEDITGMIGKRIKVTGTIAELDGAEVIRVMAVTPLE